MFKFRKITAAAALIACLGGATQLPRMMGSAGATVGRATASEHDSRRPTTRLEAHTELERTGHVTLMAHPTGLVFDKTFASANRVGATKNVGVPASVDLRQWAMPIADQKKLYSCTTWAIDYAMLGWYARRDGISGAPFAPMYTYSQINHGVDAGSQPVDALNVAMTQGTDTQADYAQGNYDWQTQPTAAEHANAANYKISGYQTLFSGSSGQGTPAINALENALSAGKPVAIAMQARTGFENLRAGTVDQDNTGTIAGGHAVLALGYDSQGLLIQNSWNTTWGDAGYGRIGWNVVGTDVYAAYTIADLVASTNNNTNDNTAAVAMGAVNVAVAPGYHVTDTVPVSANWSATGNVSRYAVWTSTNGGAWADVTSRLASPTSTSVAFGFTPGSTYRIAVAAYDAAGQRSDYSYSVVVNTKVFDDTTATTSTGWSRYNWTSAFGGQSLTSSTPGASVQFTFTGRAVAVVAPKFSTAGQANAYVDGTFVGTIDLYNATLDARSVVFSRFWTASGTHTITLKVVGTVGRPRVDVDAFAAIG
jgi:C1A family cysteine protease